MRICVGWIVQMNLYVPGVVNVFSNSASVTAVVLVE